MEAGVGFAIKKDIVTKLTEMPRPVSDRIMMSKDNFATIISVYAPTMTNRDENKEAFYNQLTSALSGIPRIDKLLLIGDFNARKGKENYIWPLVMGKHGIGKCNSNGELLLALCSEFELIVTNTVFKQTDERKTTWMRSSFQTFAYDQLHHHELSGSDGPPQHPSLAWSNLLDRSPDAEVKSGFQNTTKAKQARASKPTKLSIAKLTTTSHRESFEQDMDSALAQWEKENSTPDEVVYNTAKTYIGKPDRKHQDWFDPNDQELQTLMSKRPSPPESVEKKGALDPPLQHTKMPPDCYKNTRVHRSQTGGKGRQ